MKNTKSVASKKQLKKEDNGNKQHEKTFDKKKYKLQKYSNKYKVKQWEEKRKKAILREFHKELKKEPQNSAQILDLNNLSKNTDETSKSKKSYAFYKAKKEYQRKQEEKKKKINDAIRIRTEREKALRKYKEKKLRNYKALSRKTEKGQPIMKGRIEMLLEKIQQDLM